MIVSPVDFIENFKKPNTKEVENLFLYHACYWFAFILSEQFGGRIYYCPEECHFFTEIENSFYDIRGNVDDKYDNDNSMPWIQFKANEPLEAIKIEKNCVDFR